MHRQNESAIKYCGADSPPDMEVVAGDTLFIEWYTDGGTTDVGWSFDAVLLHASPPPPPPSPPAPPPYPLAPPLTINGSTALIHDEQYAESQLRMAILDQEVSTVYLQADVTLTQALPNVRRTLSIVGSCDGRCALDGAKEFQVLQVTDGGNLLLESLTLRNGRGTLGGAVAISQNSSLELRDCSLTRNEAAYGGALHISGGNVTMVGTHFELNMADAWGGAAYSEKRASVEGSACTFASHTAIKGGAFASTLGSKLHFSDSLFSSNLAQENGGVFFLEGSYAVDDKVIGEELNLFNCNISNNSASVGGVVRSMLGSSIEIASCVFEDNTATFDGGVVRTSYSDVIHIRESIFRRGHADERGGLIDAVDSVFEMTGSLVANCSAQTGGAFALDGAHFRLTNTSVLSNLARCFESGECSDQNCLGMGGGIHAISQTSVTVEGCQFGDNEAYFGGAFIFLNMARQSNFTNTNLTGNTAYRGGAGFVYRSSIAVLDSIFSFNNARQFGGVLFAGTTDSTERVDPEMAYYSIYLGHCGLFSNRESAIGLSISGVLVLQSVHAYGNVARAALLLSMNMTSTEALTAFSGAASDVGGLVDASTSAGGVQVVARNCTIVASEATQGGLVQLPGGSLLLEDCLMEQNVVDEMGGVVYTTHGFVRAERCSFKGNIAGTEGGVIASEASRVEIVDCDFYGNKAVHYGGILFSAAGSTIIAHSLVMDNVGGVEAGVASVRQHGTLTWLSTRFAGNFGRTGAGMVLTDGDMIVQDSVIDANYASWGMLYIKDGESSANISGSLFYNNTAVGGALLYCELCGNIWYEDNLARHNLAYKDGGIFYFEDCASELTVLHSVFKANTAENNGGLIYSVLSGRYELRRVSILISDSLLEANAAISNGGVLYIRGGKKLIMSNSTLHGNKVPHGSSQLASPYFRCSVLRGGGEGSGSGEPTVCCGQGDVRVVILRCAAGKEVMLGLSKAYGVLRAGGGVGGGEPPHCSRAEEDDVRVVSPAVCCGQGGGVRVLSLRCAAEGKKGVMSGVVSLDVLRARGVSLGW
ncbi:hypothetical protein CYMTET_24495 [Cymbomonas tetramitiformis]|uniref:Right handed beta helix domain-containing protein n=1 Tax=Cymbomonas tetramitiformis TaxID=36881 RepID=A0AAE0L071_9CHLO|nr:hypothetical protein CYMTET_24495 [Cymbomonas tetramitiformis]